MEGRRSPECPHEPRPWRRHYLDALIAAGATKAASGQRARSPPPGRSFHTRCPGAENLEANLRNLPGRLAVSATMASSEAAVEATGQVQVTSPTVRNRTDRRSTRSPSRAGVSGVTGTSAGKLCPVLWPPA